MQFLNTVINESGIGSKTANKLINTGSKMVETPHETIQSPLSNLDIPSIEKLIRRFSELGMSDARERILDCSEEAIRGSETSRPPSRTSRRLLRGWVFLKRQRSSRTLPSR